jgi:small multidrug resistance family-3 protein
VSPDGYRRPPDRIAELLNRAEPVTDTRLVREPAGFANTAQAYVMVREPEPPWFSPAQVPLPGSWQPTETGSAATPAVIVIIMTVLRSIGLFVLAAIAEIGGAWLIWQGVREHRGVAWIGAGIVALGLYGFVATLQPDANFGRILAAYGGVFVAGSLAWGMALDGYRPDRYDVTGALVCLAGVAVIMYAPRGA